VGDALVTGPHVVMELAWEQIVAYLTNPASYRGRFAFHILLWQHVWYVLVSTALAAAIAIPAGLWVGHRGRGETAVVAVANTGRAVPDFGIIILMGFFVATLSNIPVYVALVALAIPPVLVNTYVGIRQVDPEARDAAVGAGMTGWQVLTRVELPNSVPLIMTGVRTAAVQVVATATLAGFVGLGGMGRLIFDGFYAGFTRGARPGLGRVILGSVVVALLAVLTELLLGRLERALTPRGLRAAHPPVVPPEPDEEPKVLTTRAAA
jgi:osmoprotectant transport system permease protein